MKPATVYFGADAAATPRVGGTVRVEIERIGYLENRVVEEPGDSARI